MILRLSQFICLTFRGRIGGLSIFLIILTCILNRLPAFAQSAGQCPANIGFEDGTFANWKAYAGTVFVDRGVSPPIMAYSLNESGPQYDQHTIIPKGNAVDEYGEFSLNSPNGSNYVVKLGNNLGGHGAERLSYTLNVPANAGTYSIIFNYAVVLQSPNHLPFEQPKFNVQIIDETTSATTSCGSFEFIAGGSLPGFQSSKTNPGVQFRPWSPVLLDLTAYVGRRIRIEFTTNDCTFNQHFGYVYLDVTENCSYPVSGNVTCPGAEPMVLKAIRGFNEYEWSNTLTGEILGTADSLVLPGDTPVGTPISVKLIPFPGLGCVQTLFTKIEGAKVDIKQPPPACTSVDLTAPSIIAGNYPDQKYSYWADAAATIPLKDPKKVTRSGSYFIRAQTKNNCFAIGEVKVSIIPPPVIDITNPESVTYPETVDITRTYIPMPQVAYTYWKDEKATIPIRDPKAVDRDATFYIRGSNLTGCITIVPVVVNIIYDGIVIANTFTPNGDGVNDLLTVLIDNSFKIKSFKIFNKWGDVVFTTTDIYNYWDGTKNGEPLPVGVYYWMMDAVDKGEAKYRKAGSVTVLK